MNRLAMCLVLGTCLSSFAYAAADVSQQSPREASACIPREITEVPGGHDQGPGRCQGRSRGRVHLDRSHQDDRRLGSGQSTEVEHLLVFFKPEKDRPTNPKSTGSSSKLNGTWLSNPPGDFKYTIVVVRNDGKALTYDPRLIIRR